MNKLDREKIWKIFDCKCAYCGDDINKSFHVDHIKPLMRLWKEEDKGDRAGSDSIDNMFPSCPRCNRWKSTFTLEEFRKEISEQVNRLRLRSAPFRLAEDYGLVQGMKVPVVFWFEKHREKNK